MPELAEVEFVRRRWNPGLGRRITAARVNGRARVFAGCDVEMLRRQAVGARLESSEAAGKQMLFRLRAENGEVLWLGIHLGMTGGLSVRPVGAPVAKADHLVFEQGEDGRALVFADARMFGRVRFERGPAEPAWWAQRAPAIDSAEFSVEAVAEFFRRRARTPVKAALLMQERFPGVGNWMADEILWRAGIHPARRCGELAAEEVRGLHAEARWVCEQAMRIIGCADTDEWPDPPADWLFRHRWADGGRCPRTGCLLRRESVGGRTTCWSPLRQPGEDVS